MTDTSNGNPRLPGEADLLREGAVLLGMGGEGKQKDKQRKSSVKRGNKSKKKASPKWGLAALLGAFGLLPVLLRGQQGSSRGFLGNAGSRGGEGKRVASPHSSVCTAPSAS